MKQYEIEIEEIVSEIFKVNAVSSEEALRIAEDNYKKAKFVLEPGNLMDIRFKLMPED